MAPFTATAPYPIPFPPNPANSTDDFVRLLALDAANSPPSELIPNGIAPGSNNLTGNINDTISILDNLDLSLFDATFNQSFWIARNDTTGLHDGQVQFTLTAVTPVPEPSPSLERLRSADEGGYVVMAEAGANLEGHCSST